MDELKEILNDVLSMLGSVREDGELNEEWLLDTLRRLTIVVMDIQRGREIK